MTQNSLIHVLPSHKRSKTSNLQVCLCVRLSVCLRCVLTQLNEFIYN